MKCLIVLVCFCCFVASAEEASPEQLVRRIYIDLFHRIPEVSELEAGLVKVKKYEEFVDSMLADAEFKKTLARKIALHYFPNLSEKRNSEGVVDPKYFKRFIRMVNTLQKKYLKTKDFRVFIKDLVSGKGISSAKGALYFYDAGEAVESLTGRFADRVLGVPYKCAECHDHRQYEGISQLDFWSLASFFKNTETVELELTKDVSNLQKGLYKKFKTRRIDSLLGDDTKSYREWISKEKRGEFIHEGENLEFKEKGPSKSFHSKFKKLMAGQVLVLEKKVNLKHLKINYTEEKEDWVYGALPGQIRSPDLNIEPRKYLANWVVSDNNPYLNKAVTNWVSNWIFGRGFKMPLTDIYGKGLNDKMLTSYSKFLTDCDFDLTSLIKKMLMSDFYRASPTKKPQKSLVDKFVQRRFRQVPAYVLLQKVRQTQDSPQAGFEQQRANLADILSNFPINESSSESNFQGSLRQSLFVSFNENFSAFIERQSLQSAGPDKELISHTIKMFLSRFPTNKEVDLLLPLLKGKIDKERITAYGDILWTMVSAE